jgi:hypothetical protein
MLLPCTICAQGIHSAATITGALLDGDIPKQENEPAAGGSAGTTLVSNSNATNHDEPTARDSSSINCSDLSHYKWTFDPSQDLPINSALLSGAKSLLKADCTYSEGAPDYLPSSYTEIKNDTANYIIHAYEPTHVYLRLDGDHLLKWESQPGGSPRGWSAIVTASDIMTDPDRADVTQCLTDCSGLMTALLCFANTEHPTIFKGWMKGCSVPVAGCRDPYGECQEPNPVNYYRFFSQNLSDDQDRKEFQKITLDYLMPGDMIAYADTDKKAVDTGHMMLVAAVADFENDPLSKLVIVIDEIGSVHSCDTRKVKHSQGIGMGVIKLTFDKQLLFFWGADSKQPEPGAVALGRAL